MQALIYSLWFIMRLVTVSKSGSPQTIRKLNFMNIQILLYQRCGKFYPTIGLSTSDIHFPSSFSKIFWLTITCPRNFTQRSWKIGQIFPNPNLSRTVGKYMSNNYVKIIATYWLILLQLNWLKITQKLVNFRPTRDCPT